MSPKSKKCHPRKGKASTHDIKKKQSIKHLPDSDDSEEFSSGDDEILEEIKVNSSGAKLSNGNNKGKKKSKKCADVNDDESESLEDEELESEDEELESENEEVDSDDEMEEMDIDEDDEDDGTQIVSRKRKAKNSVSSEPAKVFKSNGPVRIFIGNIGNIEANKLEQYLGVTNIEIPCFDSGKRKGFGFAFVDPSNKLSILKKNFQTLEGRELKIQESRMGQTTSKVPIPSCTLHIGNLPYTTTEEQIREELLHPYQIDMLSLAQKNGQCIGFAFVKVPTLEEALKIVNKHDSQIFHGREITVQYSKEKNINSSKDTAKQPKQTVTSSSLLLLSISSKTTVETLTNKFKTASKVHIPVMKDGVSKGYAYIDFASDEEAQKALEQWQGSQIDGHTLHMKFNLKPKEKQVRPKVKRSRIKQLQEERTQKRKHGKRR